MLTVSDCLQLEIFSNARIVAGHSGLSRHVAWVHVTGTQDAAEWLNGGELVLTTPLNLPKTPEDEAIYIQQVAGKGAAALAIAVGRYSKPTSVKMRAAAEAHQFPLIEIPFTTRFTDVAKAVNQQITEANDTLSQRALDINRKLTQLAQGHRDLRDLASVLAGLIGRSISIENNYFEVLASHSAGEGDEAWRYTLREGRTNPQLITALEEQGVLAEIHDTLQLAYLPQISEFGLEMERALVPIVAHGKIYGYLWVITDDRPLEALEHMAIEGSAVTAALMLLYQETALNTEAMLNNKLISQLIQPDNLGNAGHDSAQISQAKHHSLDMPTLFSMLLIKIKDGSDTELLSRLHRQVSRITSSVNGLPLVKGQLADQLVVIGLQKDIQPLIKQIHDTVSDTLQIVISGAVQGVKGARIAYQQCQDALYIARKLQIESTLISFTDLGYLHTLYIAGSTALETSPHVSFLRLLLQEQSADLFHTLETYVDEGGNGVKTAERLAIHRSTLNYRLARIAEIGNVNLSDPETRINLQIGIKLLRLFETA
ncbi:MAG: PucR family transcriptional regulator ligand-binding domain-containing protein [Anaerolineae bacterium]|nr:PucR family transcriptional regulator ligand-binding domain-containing protein [Anaerolineae bacterium]